MNKNKEKELNSKEDTSLEELWKDIMKNTDKIVIGILLVGFVFLSSFFFNNYTGASIGLVLIGGAITLKMLDMKIRSKAIWYMWIAILVVVLFLLGLGSVIPKINFG